MIVGIMHRLKTFLFRNIGKLATSHEVTEFSILSPFKFDSSLYFLFLILFFEAEALPEVSGQ